MRARGAGPLKIELKRPDNTVLRVWTQVVDSPGWTSLDLPTTDVAEAVKLLNVVAESPSDLWVDDVTFAIEMPALTPLRYAFVVSLAQLLRANDPATGWVRDHAQWPSGAFTSVPASGEVALAVAAASQLGVVSPGGGEARAQRWADELTDSSEDGRSRRGFRSRTRRCCRSRAVRRRGTRW